MRIDFTKRLQTLNGTFLKAADTPDAEDVRLQDIATNALLLPAPESKDFAAHAKAFKLALRISNSPSDCEVDRDEIARITQAIGRAYGPAVCGPADILFDGDAVIRENEGDKLQG
jgi:hypothetical protein